MEKAREIRFKTIKETNENIVTKASVPIAKGVYLLEWLIIESKGGINVIVPFMTYRNKYNKKTEYKPLLYFQEKETKNRWLNRITEKYQTWRDQEKTSINKTKLFKETFKGRDDIFAKYWESSDGRKGYQPACKNEWKPGICSKPCYNCGNNEYLPLTDNIYSTHLKGQDLRGKLFIVGVYPLLKDSTSYFIAADFDGEGTVQEARDFMEACLSYEIPTYLERSKSGLGYHVWIFFKEKIPAWKSRTVILEILKRSNSGSENLEGFDRLFPNQDGLTGKGFGSLIALPLQGYLVKKNYTVFLDPTNQYKPYLDQWDFLRSIEKIGEEKFDKLIKSWNLTPNVKSTVKHTLGSQKALERVINNCDFIRYCIDSAHELTELLWYCMISNLAVFEGGSDKIHEFSKPYPGYTWNETEAKILHALRDTGPHNCETIHKDGFNCQRNCDVRSPAGLGYKINNVKNGGNAMDLGGRIIIVFIILVISILLLDLKEPVHDFLYSILTLPAPRHFRSIGLYHFVKLCTFLVVIVALVKILGKG